MRTDSTPFKFNPANLAEAAQRLKELPWQEWVNRYTLPTLPRSLWQAISTLVMYVAAWVGLYYTLSISYWLTLALVPIASGMLVRIFIVNHDCGHGSYFKSQRANNILGFITATLTFTAYFRWRHEHAMHHATSGDLENRGTGDVWTMTVEEYLAASRRSRIKYRIYRNPFVMFVIGPWWEFMIKQRVPRMGQQRREIMSVLWTNLALLVLIGGLSMWIGWKAVLMIQAPIFLLSGLTGVWLFYVQHQYDGALWIRHEDWDYATMCLYGSSYYKLPRVMQWFTGNIGFHHIHHLSPRIPNYLLEKAHREVPLFQSANILTFRSSLKSLRLHLWWEMEKRLVGFREIRHLIRARTAS